MWRHGLPSTYAGGRRTKALMLKLDQTFLHVLLWYGLRRRPTNRSRGLFSTSLVPHEGLYARRERKDHVDSWNVASCDHCYVPQDGSNRGYKIPLQCVLEFIYRER